MPLASCYHRRVRVHTDVKVTSSRFHFAKALSTIVGTSLVTLVTDLWRHWLSDYSLQCMPCSYRTINEALPEIHLMEKCDFIQPIIYSHKCYSLLVSKQVQHL